MAILNYTTSISAEKTAGEIQKKLALSKAQAVLFEYDEEGIMDSLSFRMMTPQGVLFFKLPANISGVYKAIKNNNKVPKKLKTREQAANVGWRILKNWIEAQLAIVEAEMAEISEVFLPYAQHHNGETVFERLKNDGYKAITHNGD